MHELKDAGMNFQTRSSRRRFWKSSIGWNKYIEDGRSSVMAKQFWKAGNMLYPVPAVMVSCLGGGEAEYYYGCLGGYVEYFSGYDFNFGAAEQVFL